MMHQSEVWASDELNQLVRTDVGRRVDVFQERVAELLFGQLGRLTLGDP